VRSGSLTVGEDDVVRAADITLGADQGSVIIDGRVDASGDNGGSIALHAGSNVTVRDGAVLDASGSAEGGAGGQIALASTRDTGELRLRSGASLLLAGGAGGNGRRAAPARHPWRSPARVPHHCSEWCRDRRRDADPRSGAGVRGRRRRHRRERRHELSQ
jgi:hypothetical protein